MPEYPEDFEQQIEDKKQEPDDTDSLKRLTGRERKAGVTARELLRPGIIYSLSSTESEPEEQDLESIFDIRIKDGLLDILNNLGVWKELDENHWQLLSLHDLGVQKTLSEKRKVDARVGSAEVGENLPWQEIRLERRFSELTPTENAFFQSMCSEYANRPFSIREFLPSVYANKKLNHDVKATIIISLFEKGFLERIDEKNKQKYRVVKKYLSA